MSAQLSLKWTLKTSPLLNYQTRGSSLCRIIILYNDLGIACVHDPEFSAVIGFVVKSGSASAGAVNNVNTKSPTSIHGCPTMEATPDHTNHHFGGSDPRLLFRLRRAGGTHAKGEIREFQ